MGSHISEKDVVPDSVTRLGVDLDDFTVDEEIESFYSEMDDDEEGLDDPDIDDI